MYKVDVEALLWMSTLLQLCRPNSNITVGLLDCLTTEMYKVKVEVLLRMSTTCCIYVYRTSSLVQTVVYILNRTSAFSLHTAANQHAEEKAIMVFQSSINAKKIFGGTPY